MLRRPPSAARSDPRPSRRRRRRRDPASGSSPGPCAGFVGFPSSPTSGPAGWKAPCGRGRRGTGQGPGGWSPAAAARLPAGGGEGKLPALPGKSQPGSGGRRASLGGPPSSPGAPTAAVRSALGFLRGSFRLRTGRVVGSARRGAQEIVGARASRRLKLSAGEHEIVCSCRSLGRRWLSLSSLSLSGPV